MNACEVDINKREIHIDYNGDEKVVDGIVEMVGKLGYEATPRPNTPSE